MKSIFTFILILSVSMSNIFAQQVRYKVKKDDPMDFKNFMLHVDPMMIDCYLTNITFGVALRADYMVNKIFDVSAQWRKPYWDMNSSTLNKDLDGSGGYGYYGKNGIKPMSWMEGTFQLHFADRVKSTNHRVVFYKSTSTSGNYQTVTTKFVDIPGHVRKIASLRGGAIWTNTSVDFSSTFGKEGEFTIKNSNNVDTALTKGGTMMRSMIVYAGLSSQSIANFKVLTDKYGMKYITPWNSFYVDFMFAPVLNFADVISKNTTSPEFKVENANIKRTGWRMGYVMRNHKGTSWSLAYNLGVRPGLVGQGGFMASRVFFDMNFGISIPNNISFKPKKKS